MPRRSATPSSAWRSTFAVHIRSGTLRLTQPIRAFAASAPAYACRTAEASSSERAPVTWPARSERSIVASEETRRRLTLLERLLIVGAVACLGWFGFVLARAWYYQSRHPATSTSTASRAPASPTSPQEAAPPLES